MKLSFLGVFLLGVFILMTPAFAMELDARRLYLSEGFS
jgi:hypothetical protein